MYQRGRQKPCTLLRFWQNCCWLFCSDHSSTQHYLQCVLTLSHDNNHNYDLRPEDPLCISLQFQWVFSIMRSGKQASGANHCPVCMISTWNTCKHWKLRHKERHTPWATITQKTSRRGKNPASIAPSVSSTSQRIKAGKGSRKLLFPMLVQHIKKHLCLRRISIWLTKCAQNDLKPTEILRKITVSHVFHPL